MSFPSQSFVPLGTFRSILAFLSLGAIVSCSNGGRGELQRIGVLDK